MSCKDECDLTGLQRLDRGKLPPRLLDPQLPLAQGAWCRGKDMDKPELSVTVSELGALVKCTH
jgi:hypothetical protein